MPNVTALNYYPAVLTIGSLVDSLSFYLLLPLTLCSGVCELLTLYIFYRSSLGTRATTRIYYLAIGVGELVTTVFKEALFYVYGIGVFAVDQSAAERGQWTPLGDAMWCPLTVFLWTLGETVANNALLAFTAECVVAAYFPFRAKVLIRKRYAYVCTALLVLEAVLVNLVIFRQYVVNTSPVLSCRHVCMPLVEEELLGATLFVFNYMLPALAGFVLTLLVVRKIRYASMKRLSRHDLSEPTTLQPTMRRNEMETCVTLVCMSAAHMLFCLPLTVFRILYALTPVLQYSRGQSALFVASIGLVHMVIVPRHVVNFAIYCRRIPHFRLSVLRLVLRRKITQRSVLNADTVDNQSKRF